MRDQDEGDRAQGDLRQHRHPGNTGLSLVNCHNTELSLVDIQLPREECSSGQKEQCRFEPREVILQKCDPTVREECESRMKPVCTEKCEYKWMDNYKVIIFLSRHGKLRDG